MKLDERIVRKIVHDELCLTAVFFEKVRYQIVEFSTFAGISYVSLNSIPANRLAVTLLLFFKLSVLNGLS